MKKPNLTEEQWFAIGQVEGIVETMGCPIVVTPHIYKLMMQSMGKLWVKKFLYKDKKVPIS